MTAFKLVSKVEHLYTERRMHTSGFRDYYVLSCGHIVSRINSDMRREKCRCYYCAGKTYKPLLMESHVYRRIEALERAKTIPSQESLITVQP